MLYKDSMYPSAHCEDIFPSGAHDRVEGFVDFKEGCAVNSLLDASAFGSEGEVASSLPQPWILQLIISQTARLVSGQTLRKPSHRESMSVSFQLATHSAAASFSRGLTVQDPNGPP